MTSNICPCCSKGCDLSAPSCHRGKEYLRTGQVSHIDECDKHRKHHKEHKHHRFDHYAEMPTPEKLVLMTTKLGRTIHHAFDSKSSQNRILHILSMDGSMTQRELTERIDIQPGSASEILKKLENSNLILRTANENDRRTMDVSLTEAGKIQAAESEAKRQASMADIFSILSSEEQEQLLILMEKLDADWDKRYRVSHGHKHMRKHHHHE